jgi:hypothetical protein
MRASIAAGLCSEHIVPHGNEAEQRHINEAVFAVIHARDMAEELEERYSKAYQTGQMSAPD